VIVDSSAIVAILHNESDSQAYADAMNGVARLRISAVTLFEASIVVDRTRNPILSRLLDTFVRDADLVVEPVTEAQVKIARDAYRDFGRGSGHPAGLNFGDCFAYALAKAMGEPLLFKGDDFSKTDIESALTA
jgi:ribonuclease VapC